jgi:flagellar biosynthesis protein FlhF
MKIKRFNAPDMRTAFRLVREEQGPGAVILSSRRTDGGVEVVAATDYDEALVQQALRSARRQAAAPAPEGAPPPPAPKPQAAAPAEPPRPLPPPEPAIADDPILVEMRRELAGMRALLEREIARHAHERLRVSPQKAQVLDDLEEYGCEPEMARAIAACIGDGIDARKARGHALGLWAKSIPTVRGDITADGGMFALVGPTGVGKTTTIAKLAARFARRRGPRDIALVTTDAYRIGAREQLYTYGRLIGVPVFEAGDRETLAATLARLAEYRLVLVDTAGMSQRDRSLAAQLAWIEAIPTLRAVGRPRRSRAPLLERAPGSLSADQARRDRPPRRLAVGGGAPPATGRLRHRRPARAGGHPPRRAPPPGAARRGTARRGTPRRARHPCRLRARSWPSTRPPGCARRTPPSAPCAWSRSPAARAASARPTCRSTWPSRWPNSAAA